MTCFEDMMCGDDANVVDEETDSFMGSELLDEKISPTVIAEHIQVMNRWSLGLDHSRGRCATPSLK